MDNIKMKDIFEIDRESGRLIPLPIKWSNTEKKSGEKATTKPKQVFDLKPLRLTAADFEEHQPRAKKMKVESKSVRKGLFTAAGHKLPHHRYSAVPTAVPRRSVISGKLTSTSRNQEQNRQSSIMASPLLDLESCEEQLLKKPGYNFQSPREPRYEFTQNQNVNPPKSAKNSPISAMCNLLQNAGISSTKKLPRLNNIPSSALKEIIEMENTEYEKLESTQTEELTELKRMIEVHLQLVESLMDIKHKKENEFMRTQKKTSREIRMV
ncbi:unnamed protein product, partial [Callosobruchus maculatus]